jgi:septal ring factor EnvC (AmiA/AmiB activator)
MIEDLELKNYSKEELENLEMFLAEDENEFLEEGSKLSLEKRKTIPDDMFAVILTVKDKKTGEPRKIRKYPIDIPDRVRAALRYLGMPRNQTTLKKLGVSIDSVKQKILKRAKELNMKDLLAKYEKSTVEEQAKLFKETIEEVAKIKTDAEAVVKEVATLKESVTAKDAELATLKTELETVKKTAEAATAEIAKRDKEIKDAEIAKRKTELGDLAKDMTDEDIMNEDKFKIAKLTKENADLKSKVEAAAKPAEKVAEPVKAAEVKAEADLDKGSKDKKKDNEIFTTQKRVTEKAFGKETK